jgi:hypothetical protein
VQAMVAPSKPLPSKPCSSAGCNAGAQWGYPLEEGQSVRAACEKFTKCAERANKVPSSDDR